MNWLNNSPRLLKIIPVLILVGIMLPGGIALAQTFTPLVGIPGVTGTDNQGIGGYMNAIYRLSISIAALLAVLVLVRAGIRYMFSDIVTQKADAKKDIKGAILGLLLIISAVLILSTINRDLTNFDIIISPLDLSRVVQEESSGEMSELNRWCADGGSCQVEPCSNLGNYAITALGGAGAGVGIAITAGVLGLTTPVGWVALATIGAGAAVGGQYGAEQTLCYATCTWLGGRVQNNACYIPNDRETANEAERERIIAEIEERGRQILENTETTVGGSTFADGHPYSTENPVPGGHIDRIPQLANLDNIIGHIQIPVNMGNVDAISEQEAVRAQLSSDCESRGGSLYYFSAFISGDNYYCIRN